MTAVTLTFWQGLIRVQIFKGPTTPSVKRQRQQQRQIGSIVYIVPLVPLTFGMFMDWN